MRFLFTKRYWLDDMNPLIPVPRCIYVGLPYALFLGAVVWSLVAEVAF